MRQRTIMTAAVSTLEVSLDPPLIFFRDTWHTSWSIAHLKLLSAVEAMGADPLVLAHHVGFTLRYLPQAIIAINRKLKDADIPIRIVRDGPKYRIENRR